MHYIKQISNMQFIKQIGNITLNKLVIPQYAPLLFFSHPFTFIVDGRALDSSPDHAIPPHPLLPSTMNDREFGGQVLSLYHSYIERGYPVSLQLWSTQDGGQHCKFSCPPIQHLRPPTQLIKPLKPVDTRHPVDVAVT